MNDNQMFKTTKVIYPQIYAYILTTIPEKEGWVKIGYTERKDVHERIQEQTHTAAINLPYACLWSATAQYKESANWFKDTHFHSYLTRFKKIERQPKTEWFNFGSEPENSWKCFEDFISHQYEQGTSRDAYSLRSEQQDAVNKTLQYFSENDEDIEYESVDFLWNAKPRFGKTLTAYHLARELKARNVLILTNRPSVSNSWFDDFEKFIGWQTHYKFVSTSDSLKDRPCLTREEFLNVWGGYFKNAQIAFISLQDLKGAIAFGGNYDKLEWVKELKWDLVIIDESHEGVDTLKTEIAFDNIQRKYTLYLSGTPFKQVASGQFEEEQIYNWTYADEQSAKKYWDDCEDDNTPLYGALRNPYASLPRLSLYSYQMSQMLTDKVNQGAQINGENFDYAFDLNEFFSTKENGAFTYEEQVKKWLDTLSTNVQYPFSTEELRSELKHTFWLLSRVASAKALQKILKDHPVFKEYNIILAAGDGRSLDNEDEANQKSFDKVREALSKHARTITLSVGQLTTGVTIPEWTAVLILSNIKSPALYMQAAFRSQNAWEFMGADGVMYRKEQAYVFDFAPERTLVVYDEFANNLSLQTSSGGGTTHERKENIRQLLNFFPVIAMDNDGQMIELDVEHVLTIPKTIKAEEVVRRGFMSNLLFQNISGIFSASSEAREILEQLKPVPVGKIRPETTLSKIDTQGVTVDAHGDVEVDNDIVIAQTKARFGEKLYEQISEHVGNILPDVTLDMSNDTASALAKKVAIVFTKSTQDSVKLMAKESGLTASQATQIMKSNELEIQKEVSKIQRHAEIEAKLELKKFQKRLAEAKKKKDIQAQKTIEAEFSKSQKKRQQGVQGEIAETVAQKSKELSQKTAHTILKKREEKKKDSVEESIRARLRGFARTIPSFIMGYGTQNTTLKNFDETLDNDVFHEVTGITLEQFRLLRDTHHFFNEVVFDEAIQAFLRKKIELANYFDKEQSQDIFDYIPPQKTNQIFTPKCVVKQQINLFEKENPGVFSDPNQSFVDFYMKSGLYITEIITRLYSGLESIFPNNHMRLKHILENQVYGFAPSEIIFNIAKNFIFGFVYMEEFKDMSWDVDMSHFVCLDTVPYAIETSTGTFIECCANIFNLTLENEHMKFDNIVGNPPYQINDNGLRDDGKQNASATNIYPRFVELAKKHGRVQSLVMPSRWTSGAGKGIKQFARTMLEDTSIKSLVIFKNSRLLFPNNEIKGGVCYFVRKEGYSGPCDVTVMTKTYTETSRKFLKNPIAEVFVQSTHLETILDKVNQKTPLQTSTLQSIVSHNKPYGLRTDFLNNPQKYALPPVSFDASMDNSIAIHGLIKGKRGVAYVGSDYPFDACKDSTESSKLEFQRSLGLWKVFIANANGDGKLGESFSAPIVAGPNVICTETFNRIGQFNTEEEALNLQKYIKTKFLRMLVGILKTTQHNPSRVWRCVPIQDFTTESDIHWHQSVPEIDHQLYRKYGLSQEEIEFIEATAQSMTQSS